MPDQPDLTELVRHLRMVHFAFLLACILTLLPTMAGRRGEVSEAHLQLQKIEAMRNSWDRWTQKFSLEQTAWLQKQGVHWLAPESEHAYIDSATLTEAGIRHSPGYVFGVRFIGGPLYFHLHVKGQPSDLILAVPHGELNKSDVLPLKISFPGEDSGSKRFTSLTAFREFWTGARLPEVTFLRRVSSVAYMIVDGTIRGELRLKEKDQAAGSMDFRGRRLGGCLGLDLELIHKQVGDAGFNEFFCSEQLETEQHEHGRLVIPAEVRTVRVPTDLRQWLIQEFRLNGAGGDFPEMFPELDNVTSVYQILDTDKIDKILRAELARQGERVQFLGMSLPEPLLASWGIVIIFAVQTYFWLHLRVFNSGASSNTVDASRYAGWIGLYNDRWASFVSILTVSIFPPLVVVWSGFVSSWPFWLLASITVIVLKLAWDSRRLLSEINHRCPAQRRNRTQRPPEGKRNE